MKTGAPRSRAEASVLIVVMWACLGLVAMTLVFAQAMAMNYRGAGNDLAGRQADAAIDGAARYAQCLLSSLDVAGVFPDATNYECEDIPVGDAAFWFLGGGSQTALDPRPYGLVDEAAKLNVNTATASMLAQLPGMTPDFAAAIVSWRSAAGADASLATGSVSGLSGSSYTPKNAPFETTEEIGTVNGADKTFLYGEDANLNGALDPNEEARDKTLPADNSDGKLDPRLLAYLTVFSREPNKRADGTPRINVRRFADAAAQLRELFASTPALAGRFPEVSAKFAGNPAVGSVLEFYKRSGLKAEEFAPIADALTTRNGDYIPGLVNVNTASAEVLACLPGIGADRATKLVAARANRAVAADVNIAWAGDVLEPQNAIQAGPFLTAASYQASADVAAVGRNGRGYRRTRFVIDTSAGAPRIIYRRDLSGLGWALGSEARQTLAKATR